MLKMGAVERQKLKRNFAVPVNSGGEHQNWRIIRKGLWLSYTADRFKVKGTIGDMNEETKSGYQEETYPDNEIPTRQKEDIIVVDQSFLLRKTISNRVVATSTVKKSCNNLAWNQDFKTRTS